MRTYLIFSTIACLLAQTNSKPLRAIESHDSDTGEAEYENNEELAAEDYPQGDQATRMDSQEEARSYGRRQASRGNSRFPDLTNIPYKQRLLNPQSGQLANFDNFPELSGTSRDMRNEKTTSRNLDLGPVLQYQQPNAYVENNEQEAKQHFSDHNVKLNHAQNLGYGNDINKRAMLSLSDTEVGDLLFENNRNQVNKIDKGEYAREVADANVQSRYNKQLYKTIPAEIRNFPEYKKYEKLHLNINRDRRQVQKLSRKESNESTLSPEENKKMDTVNEDEESAIKRHVKKLSEQELEELFNTLSEEKRTLLKKIIETDFDFDEGINKREITKKAGAIEENNYIENGQLDSSKIQGGNPNVDVTTEPSISHETTDNNKRPMSPTETGDVISTKNTGGAEKPENKVELTDQNEDIREVKSESNLDLIPKKSENEANLECESESKAENKREANMSEMLNDGKLSEDSNILNCDYNLKDFQGSINNQELFSDDGELSDLINEETEMHNSYKNNYKRDASLNEPSDLSVSIKSLEESFPNPNANDKSNPMFGSDLAPLVRVKRRNAESAILKRAASVIADSKVPYFPNKGENDDEDNDEGGEFDEDGFYDRTSNYARGNENHKSFEINPYCSKIGDKILKQRIGHNYGHENDNIESLGSDTDNVMTGVEGVNDNLMYSSRNGRASEENANIRNLTEEKLTDVTIERRLGSTLLTDSGEEKTGSENNINEPGYQENDAFGPLPRNYEGDLGRYKRIRRLKQSPVFADNTSL